MFIFAFVNWILKSIYRRFFEYFKSHINVLELIVLDSFKCVSNGPSYLNAS